MIKRNVVLGATLFTSVLLTSALAETKPTTDTDKMPPSVTRTALPALEEFLAAGGTVQLMDVDGTAVGSVNADGTVKLNDGVSLSDVKSVKVAAADQSSKTYTFSRDLNKPGAVKIDFTLGNGKVVSLPLPAVVNRQAEAHVAKPATENADKNADQAKTQKPEKPEKPATPVKGPKK